MKCSAGLALIINDRFSGNVGSFVTLKKVALVHGELGAFWTFEKASKPLMFGYGEYEFTVAKKTTQDNNAYLRDVDLHPILKNENQKLVRTDQ